MTAEATLTPSQARFLRYWSLNMTLAQRMGGRNYLGFSYTAEEYARMAELATGATRGVTALWMTAVVVTYMVVAFVAVGVVVGGALLTVWRGAADVSEPPIFVAIALMIAVMLGLGMPLSIGVGGAAADILWRERVQPEARDAALQAKVARQFRRVGLGVGALVIVAAIAWTVLISLH